MRGGVTSGAEKAKAAAAVAALVVLPPTEPELLEAVEPPSKAESPAAAAPQVRLTLQVKVEALQVRSDGPQGSYTDSILVAVTDRLAASTAV